MGTMTVPSYLDLGFPLPKRCRAILSGGGLRLSLLFIKENPYLKVLWFLLDRGIQVNPVFGLVYGFSIKRDLVAISIVTTILKAKGVSIPFL